MTKLPQSNIYSASAEDVRELFGDYLDGSEACIALAVSARRLDETAREAIAKSLAALGYGDDACTFATLSPQGAGAGGATGVGAGGAETAGAAGAGGAGAGGATGAGGVRLDAQALFMLVEGLDPLCVICTDAAAAEALGGAYRTGFSLDAPARVFGRPAVTFRDFAALLATDDGKQRAWKLLKSLPKR